MTKYLQWNERLQVCKIPKSHTPKKLIPIWLFCQIHKDFLSSTKVPCDPHNRQINCPIENA
jgi:hypothetical protein